MMRLGKARLATTILLSVVGMTCLGAEPQQPTPDFKEVYDLIRAHLVDTSEADLNRAAVQGLLTSLGGRVSLVGASGPTSAADSLLVNKTSLFDGPIAYV